MSERTEPMELMDEAYWKVLLNPNQQNLGQSLIILKENKSSLAELGMDEWEEFGAIVKMLEEAITSEFNPTHFNWQCLMNNAYEAEAKEGPHVHWHLSPRYSQPVTVADTKFIDKNYPRTNKEPRFVEESVFRQIADRIRLNFYSE